VDPVAKVWAHACRAYAVWCRLQARHQYELDAGPTHYLPGELAAAADGVAPGAEVTELEVDGVLRDRAVGWRDGLDVVWHETAPGVLRHLPEGAFVADAAVAAVLAGKRDLSRTRHRHLRERGAAVPEALRKLHGFVAVHFFGDLEAIVLDRFAAPLRRTAAPDED